MGDLGSFRNPRAVVSTCAEQQTTQADACPQLISCPPKTLCYMYACIHVLKSIAYNLHTGLSKTCRVDLCRAANHPGRRMPSTQLTHISCPPKTLCYMYVLEYSDLNQNCVLWHNICVSRTFNWNYCNILQRRYLENNAILCVYV